MPQSGDGWPTVDDDGTPVTGPTDDSSAGQAQPAWPAPTEAEPDRPWPGADDDEPSLTQGDKSHGTERAWPGESSEDHSSWFGSATDDFPAGSSADSPADDAAPPAAGDRGLFEPARTWPSADGTPAEPPSHDQFRPAPDTPPDTPSDDEPAGGAYWDDSASPGPTDTVGDDRPDTRAPGSATTRLDERADDERAGGREGPDSPGGFRPAGAGDGPARFDGPAGRGPDSPGGFRPERAGDGAARFGGPAASGREGPDSPGGFRPDGPGDGTARFGGPSGTRERPDGPGDRTTRFGGPAGNPDRPDSPGGLAARLDGDARPEGAHLWPGRLRGDERSWSDPRRPDPPRPPFQQGPPGEATVRVQPVQPGQPGRQDQWPPPEPPRAAPWRVEPRTESRAESRAEDTPPPDEPDTDEDTPTQGNRRRLVITLVAVVAVLGLAAGVVFGVPGLSDKLGITDGEPEVVVEPPAPPVEFQPGLRAPDGAAPAPSAAGVQAALAGPASSPALGTLTGVVVDPATGETLWQASPDTPLTPASTGKLLTAAAALLSVEHTAQFSTTVVEGAEPGSVIIVGGGDPTLSSLKDGVESVYPGAARLGDLVEQVKAAGTPVNSVQVDLSRFAGDSSARGWLPADIAAGYITPIVPAMLDGGRSDATAQNGTRTANPARALAEEFAARIGASVPTSAEQTAPEGAKVLGEVRSAPLVELVDTILRTSDNVLAEAIAREVAHTAGKEVSFDGGSQATLDVLRDNGFDINGVVLADGSGLSTEDRVPAKLLGEILAVAAAPDGEDPRTAKLRPLLGGLPVAGGSGTLDDRYGTQEAVAGKGYVRAKTGTLSGVNSLAGVVLNQDGRVMVFALMTGDTDSSARPALDAIAATLRGCGCG